MRSLLLGVCLSVFMASLLTLSVSSGVNDGASRVTIVSPADGETRPFGRLTVTLHSEYGVVYLVDLFVNDIRVAEG